MTAPRHDPRRLRVVAERGEHRGADVVLAAAVRGNVRRRVGGAMGGAFAAVTAAVVGLALLGSGDTPDVIVNQSTTSSAAPTTSVSPPRPTFAAPFDITGLGEAFGSLWLIGGPVDGPGTDRLGHVLRLDRATGRVSEDIEVDGEPVSIGFSDQSVWVRTAGMGGVAPVVVQISPSGEHGPRETPTQKDGRLFAVGDGAWVTDGIGELLFIGEDGNVQLTTPLPGGELTPPLFVTGDNEQAILTSPYDGAVHRVNRDTGSLEVIAELGGANAGAALAGETVWIRSQGGLLHRVSLIDERAIVTIGLPSRTRAVAIVGDDVIALGVSGQIYRLDPVTNHLEELVGVVAGSLGPAAQDDGVWIVPVTAPDRSEFVDLDLVSTVPLMGDATDCASAVVESEFASATDEPISALLAEGRVSIVLTCSGLSDDELLVRVTREVDVSAGLSDVEIVRQIVEHWLVGESVAERSLGLRGFFGTAGLLESVEIRGGEVELGFSDALTDVSDQWGTAGLQALFVNGLVENVAQVVDLSGLVVRFGASCGVPGNVFDPPPGAPCEPVWTGG